MQFCMLQIVLSTLRLQTESVFMTLLLWLCGCAILHDTSCLFVLLHACSTHQKHVFVRRTASGEAVPLPDGHDQLALHSKHDIPRPRSHFHGDVEHVPGLWIGPRFRQQRPLRIVGNLVRYAPTLHPTPCTLRPTPNALHSTLYTLHPNFNP